MADRNGGSPVTNRQLSAELRALRWEMRALIALAGLVNLGLGYKLNLPGVSEAVGLALRTLPL